MSTETSRTPRCSVFIAVSLDGYIARPDGAIDWLSIVQQEGEDYGYQAFADSCDALVIGRNTYETVLGFDAWPYEGKRVVVLTHRQYSSRRDETFFAGSPDEVVQLLGREGVRRIYVDGGAVIQQFLAARRIDDLTISVVPILLGSGIPLFGGGAPEQRLRLSESRSWPTGLVQVRYSVVG